MVYDDIGSVEVQIKGTEKLLEQLTRIKNVCVVQAQDEALVRMARETKFEAQRLAPVLESQLKNNIEIKHYKTITKGAKQAKVQVLDRKVPYVNFVYFGTGEYMDMNSVYRRYGRQQGALGEWLVHESQFTKDISKYNFEYIDTIYGDRFYKVKGQKPKKFLQQAFTSRYPKNIEESIESYNKWLRRK